MKQRDVVTGIKSRRSQMAPDEGGAADHQDAHQAACSEAS